MRIAAIKTQNVMRCNFAEVRFDGDTLQLVGANGEGKSSFAKSIWMCLGGKDAIPDEPVSGGAEEAVIDLELTEGDSSFLLQRIIYPNRETKLVLKSKDGARYPSAQKMLDEFNCRYGFWPQEFINAKPKEQQEVLRKIVNLDFTEIDTKIAELREDRHKEGIVGKQYAGMLNNLTKVELPPEPENTAAIFAQIKDLTSKQDAEGEKILKLNKAKVNFFDAENEVKRLMAELKIAEEVLERATRQLISAKGEAETLIDYQAQIVELEKKMQQVDSDVANYRQQQENNKQFDETTANVEEYRTKYESYTEDIKKLEASKREQLAAAPFPVAGLGFTEDGISFNDHPFEQASTAQKWDIAIAINLALNPRLKLCYIEHGPLLDANTYERVSKRISEAGGQLIIEMVQQSVGGDVPTVVFEDGRGTMGEAAK
jgi:DNA repair exonuclease SbcCD ATPase subunit